VIIWGSRGREIEQKRGQFFCPKCADEQTYRQVRVSTYFTLYFIPLFETQHHGDYVECQGCRGQYRPEVLDYKPPSDGERVLGAIRADLEAGTPLQMACTKLTNQGVDLEVAQQIVELAAGDDSRACPGCNLKFIQSVRRCSSCGTSLGGEAGYRA
jgi:hypothetical protein